MVKDWEMGVCRKGICMQGWKLFAPRSSLFNNMRQHSGRITCSGCSRKALPQKTTLASPLYAHEKDCGAFARWHTDSTVANEFPSGITSVFSIRCLVVDEVQQLYGVLCLEYLSKGFTQKLHSSIMRLNYGCCKKIAPWPVERNYCTRRFGQ